MYTKPDWRLCPWSCPQLVCKRVEDTALGLARIRPPWGPGAGEAGDRGAVGSCPEPQRPWGRGGSREGLGQQ